MKTPPDYGTSFQALKRTTDPDSLHVYYPLFWDVNLLECAIAQHHKRGETCEFTSLFCFSSFLFATGKWGVTTVTHIIISIYFFCDYLGSVIAKGLGA